MKDASLAAKYSISNGDICELLLADLLDLRESTNYCSKQLKKNIGVRFYELSLVDELLLSLRTEALDPLFASKIKERLNELCQKESLKRSEILEMAQGYAWMAKRHAKLQLENFHEKKSEGIFFHEKSLCYLGKSLTALLRLHQSSCWRRFLQKGFDQEVRFFIASIRLEMREAGPWFKDVELAKIRLKKAQDLEEKLIKELKQGDLLEAKILLSKQRRFKNYSFYLQIKEEILKLALRQQRSLRMLSTEGKSKISLRFKLYLLSRIDVALKELCMLLRLCARHPRSQLEFLNPLGEIASQGWSDLEKETFELANEVKDDFLIYWKLLGLAHLLRLGARLGGRDPYFEKINPLEWKEDLLKAVEIEEKKVLSPVQKLFLLSLALVDGFSFSAQGLCEMDRKLINSIEKFLKKVAEGNAYNDLRSRLEACAGDLHLLFHRDARAGPLEVLRTLSHLLNITPMSSERVILEKVLYFLTELINLFSGASFRVERSN